VAAHNLLAGARKTGEGTTNTRQDAASAAEGMWSTVYGCWMT